MNRLEEYNNIDSPVKLYEFMDKYIKYGYKDKNNKLHYPSDKDFNELFSELYVLSSSLDVINNGLGNCFDQVELERDWFNKNNYKFKTNFIWFELDYENNYNCHTYLIYQNNLKYYLFEHADSCNSGIHEFNSYVEAVKWQYDRFIESNKKAGNIINEEIIKNIHIYEYNIPETEISFEKYIDYILGSKEITNIIK